MIDEPLIAPENLDPSTRDAWRVQIARLPLSMQPALNQQVDTWDNLFPFEQKRAAEFLSGLSSFQPDELATLTDPLHHLELKMDLAHWKFSLASNSMTNASQLARSPYYSEWRQEVQRVFSAIEARARATAQLASTAGRLIIIVLPDALPIESIPGHKPWDPRALEFRVEGDTHRIAELAFNSSSGLPALIASQSAPSGAVASESWLIDADAHLGNLLASPPPAPMSVLQYAALKSFKDQFLSEVNTAPKDIEGTDQILARMRHQDWSPWWPASLAGQDRLRSFVTEVFLSGNGALIFSNAFVQWAASEAIRRARPRLVVARFGLRARPKPFTGIAIFENQQKISALRDVDDPEGSAMDALILARYIWLSARRYPEAQQTSCICIGESSRSVYVIAPEGKRPAWPAGIAATPEQIYNWMRTCLV
jgi:hypothetical protein